jgi:hypothetical protein
VIGIIFAIGCKSPFLGFGFRWSGRKPTYTLSLFTQSNLRHPEPRRIGIRFRM